ncbi:MAG: DUF1566 domain-containing protein [Magnetococcales bacterium]|nr:DUF1566 domain-containing protein [Magnetococcales bacterium]
MNPSLYQRGARLAMLILFVLGAFFPFQAGQADDLLAPLPRTGQTVSSRSGDDGDLEKGVAWPAPRFLDLGNGTVRDQLTGLVWIKHPDCFQAQNWFQAMDSVINLNSGLIGCTDYIRSSHQDWRLPNRKELLSLIDFSRSGPALPAGHPFSTNRSDDYYWSSTTYRSDTVYAWVIDLSTGLINRHNKGTLPHAIWPVRGGQ